MAEIRSFLVARHLRADATAHVLLFRRGRLRRSGPGLSAWFLPLDTTLAEVPLEDRELTLVLHGRSADFQEVSAQGALTFRVADPARLAARVDFGLDPVRGVHLRQPLEQLDRILGERAQQLALDWFVATPVREVLSEGQTRLREALEALVADPALAGMGLEVVSVRIAHVRPSPDLEKALEAPMREHIKQEADEAAFQRRALAVEKERAIQENELQNRIELARREESLIDQQGRNARREAEERAEAEAIAARAAAVRTRLEAEAEADADRQRTQAEAEGVRAVEGARSEAEAVRLEALGALGPAALLALGVRDLAGKLERIDHLNLGPDLLGPALVNLLEAGSRRLNGGE